MKPPAMFVSLSDSEAHSTWLSSMPRTLSSLPKRNVLEPAAGIPALILPGFAFAYSTNSANVLNGASTGTARTE